MRHRTLRHTSNFTSFLSIFFIVLGLMTTISLSAQMMADKDNDSVVDFIDMDSDNDGIMDMDEGVACDVVNLNTEFPMGSVNALMDFNDAMIVVGGVNGALIQVDTSFQGGATLDEFEISNRHTGGNNGLLLGVNSQDPSQTLTETYTFSELVCDFSVNVWDLDRTDAIIVRGTNNGVPVPFTITNQGACIGYDGMFQLESLCNVQVEPPNPDIVEHMFTLQFDGCIDMLSFEYFDLGPGNGGSFTFVPTPFPTCVGPDTDMDGVIDALDQDSDNDGIPDAIEACGMIDLVLEGCALDNDGDGTYIFMAGESTGKLEGTCADAPIDTDGDMIPDFLDLDSDGDGCPDATEACTNGNPNVNDTDVSDGYMTPPNGVDTCGLVIDADGMTVSCENPPSINYIDDGIGCLACVANLVSNADCNVENGSATSVPSGGNGPYTYLWSNAETTPTAIMLAPGLATVTITDSCGEETICTVTIPEVPCMPCLDITKSSTLALGADGIANVGDVITYSYSILNCGNDVINSVSVSENDTSFSGTGTLPSPTAVSPPNLDIGAIGTATSTYIVTQADIDAGFVDNQATASGIDRDNNPVEDLSDTGNVGDVNETGGDDDPTNTPINPEPCVELTKGSTIDLGVDGIPTPGDVVTYSYTILNCGNVTLSNVDVEEQAATFTGTGTIPSPGMVSPAMLAPGETGNATATYSITQVDIDAGFIDNQALVNASDPSDTAVMDLSDTANQPDVNETGGDDDPTNTPLTQEPCISITKGSSLNIGADGVANPGDVITFTYAITNCGNVTLSDVVVTEEAAQFTGTGTLPVPGSVIPAILAPGQSANASSSYTITQADIDAEVVINQALATGNDPSGNPVTDLSDTSNPGDPAQTPGEEDPTTTPITPEPCIVLTKGSMLDLGADGIATVGDIINYTYTATNCGNTTLSNVSITEQQTSFSGTGTIPVPTPADLMTLLPGESATSSATYAITQVDIDNGSVDNQAIVTGNDPMGDPVEDLSDTTNPGDVNETAGPDDPTNTPIGEVPCISLTKGSTLALGADNVATPGDIITYNYEVTNCGNVTLDNITISEQAASFSGTGSLPIPGAVLPNTLAPGQTANASSTYAITQADIDAGFVDNQALSSGNDPDGNPTTDLSDTSNLDDLNETGGPDDPTNTPIGLAPCVELTKGSMLNLGADGIATPGDMITYTYTVLNCGNVTISNLSIIEQIATFSGTGALPSPGALMPDVLSPGQSASSTASYAITQADIDAGFIDNQAIVSGTDPENNPVSDLSDTSNLGDINDTGGPDDPTNTPIEANPCIVSTKGSSIDVGGDNVVTAGDLITYNYQVMNCGNVTLSLVEINEQQGEFSGTGTLPVPGDIVPSTLTPGQSANTTSTYMVTQEDIDAGFVDNQILVTSTDPNGNAVTDLSDSSNLGDINDTGGPDDPTNTPLEANPCIVSTKGSSVDSGVDNVVTVGDLITYNYQVMNCGNVTLSLVEINEQQGEFSGTGTLPVPGDIVPSTLSPGQTANTTSTYMVTQEDIDAGFVDNQILATSTDPNGNAVTDLSDSSNLGDINDTGGPDDPTNTPLSPSACLFLSKGSSLDIGEDGVATPGDLITYTYLATNCGNVTLSNITIDEDGTIFTGTGTVPVVGAVTPTTIMPGESATANATYAITQDDIDAGFVDNQAIATGTDPDNNIVSDLSDTSNPLDVNDTGGSDDPTNTPIDPDACVELTKGSSLNLGVDEIATPGDIVTYTYTVLNCGNVSLSNVIIDEQSAIFTGTGSLPMPGTVTPAVIEPGATGLARANYAITQADIDAGFIDNQAIVMADDPEGNSVDDISDTSNPVDVNQTAGNEDPTNTPVPQEPCIELNKGSSLDLGGDGVASPGDVITYTYQVLNCGNVTLDNITISEQIAGFSGSGSLPTPEAVIPSVLSPGQSANSTSTYAITQADIDAGFVDNQALATGDDPAGVPTTDLSDTSNPNDANESGGPDDPTNTTIMSNPCISLTKGSSLNLGADGVATPGDVITYSYEVTNCGNVTISGVTITEQAADFSGSGTIPVPGEVIPSTLNPGQSAIVTSTYIITQTDIDNSEVINQALTSGSDPAGNPITDLSDTSNPNDMNETGGPDDPTTTPIGPDPCISLTKGSLLDLGVDGVATPNDVITYTYQVTNCGNVTLTDVLIVEQAGTFTGTGSLPVPGAVMPSVLEPGESATVSSTYLITQTDIDAGFVDNQALATATDPDSGPVTDLSDTSNLNDANETGGPDDPTNTPIGLNPCLSVTKGSSLNLNGDLVATPGDIITYTYEITNCGNVTIDNITLVELPATFTGSGSLPAPGAVLPSTLSPGQSVSTTATYAITQVDIDAGFVDNQALASGTDPENAIVEDLSDTSNPNDINETEGSDDPTNTPIIAEPCIVLTKGSLLDVGTDGIASAGDLVTYTYRVANCGNVTLTDINIIEDAATFTGTGILPTPGAVIPSTLAPGQSANTSSTYVLTQEDVNNALLNNQAITSGNDPDGNSVTDLSDTSNPNDINETNGDDDPTNTPLGLNSCIVLTKGSSLDLGADGVASVGDIITYTYMVTNCGNVTLTNVNITEQVATFSGTGTLPMPSILNPSTLDPGESATATATYAITQMDIDASGIDNQALATGTDPDGNPTTDLSDSSNPNDPNETGGGDDPTNTNIGPDPCITLTKGSSLNFGADGVATPGDIITYTYEVTNCGNVTLTDVDIAEQAATFTGTGSLPTPSGITMTTLEPGESATASATYAITLADINAGVVNNQALASGNDPDGDPTTDLSDTSNPDDPNDTGGDDDPTSTIIGPDPCINLTKGSSLALGADGIATPGDIITYTYVVTNCGNVTLTDVAINENNTTFSGSGPLPIPGPVTQTTLDPGESTTATATYAITLADINAGGIDNQALASGNDPMGDPTSDLSDSSNPGDPNDTGGDDDPTFTNIGPEACISLTKGSSLDTGEDGIPSPGDVITYIYIVTNCGNVTVSDIEITELAPTFTGSGALPVPTGLTSNTLDPGESATASATYMLTQADIDAGSISNQALATGNDPEGNQITDRSDSSNPNDPNDTGGEDDPTSTDIAENPCISLLKGSFLELGADGVASVGDILTYTYSVSNCGNVTLSDIVISELANMFTGTNGLPMPSNTTPSVLAPGQNALASATYIITQADIDAGSVVNQALVIGTAPDGDAVEDISDSSNPNDPADTGGEDDPTTTTIGENPCIELRKGSFLDLGADQIATPGDMVTYSYTIRNCGNVTVSNLLLSESIADFTGSGTLPTPDPLPVTLLAPGESTTSTASYMITQADIDAGQIINQALVFGQSPDGDPVQDISDTANPNDPTETGGNDDPTYTEVGENPCVELVKGSSFDQGSNQVSTPGDIVTYSYTIKNCGNVTIANLVLSENVVSFTGTGDLPVIPPLTTTSLAPGETVSISSTYAITAMDISTGFINNQAVVSAIDPTGTTLSDLSDTNNPNDVNETGGFDDPTNTPIEQPATVSGTTFEDLDGDGDLDQVLPFVEVTLTDAAGNVQTTISDVNGEYTFSDVAVGEFTVVETDPDGFNSVEDADGNNDNVITGVVVAGQVSVDNDFIDEEPADISGTVTDDDDNDGMGEVPLVGVTVTLIDRDGDEFTTVTDENGEYIFTDVDPGPYTVIETDPGDFVSVGDADGGDPNVIVDVLMSGDDSTDNDFIDGICDELVCNGELQISLNQDCLLELTPDMLLEFPAVGIYTIEILDENNVFLRDSFLTAEDVGETRKYKISCLDNSCWGEIIVEANQVPQFQTPCPLTEDGSVPEDCIFWCGAEDITPDLLITAEEVKQTFGDCGPDLIGDVIVRETRIGDICDDDGQIVEIVYTGKVMQHGAVRSLDILTQRYSIMKLDISGSDEDFFMNFGFPEDIVLDCGSLTSPEEIYKKTEDFTMAYPYYVDMHRLVDQKLRIIDSIEIIVGQVERDTMIKELIGNDSLWVLKTIVDKITEYIPDTIFIDNPDGPVNPKVPIKNGVCNIQTGYTDLTFDACGDGQKVIRSWEMIDWCSSDIIRTKKQIIEVKDVVKPKIFKLVNGKKVQTSMLDDMIVGIDPWVCSARIELPELLVEDNCDDNPEVVWQSHEGVVEDGFLTGIWFTAGPVEVIGLVTDQCGNTDSVSFRVIIVDDVAPVAICDIALQISLTGNSDGYGTATLFAKDIDEGSHDSGCGKVKLSAVRVEDWVNRVRDCNNQFIGYEPATCAPLTSEIDAGEVVSKQGCTYNGNSVKSVTRAGEFVRFCCEDAGKIVQVLLIVEDEYGNVTLCDVAVEVVDKAQPTIRCTQDVITCDEDQTIKTPPLVGGLCESEKTYEVELYKETRSNNACSGGQSIREWFIDLDQSGDYTSGDAYCRQIISIKISAPFNPYSIKWPKHYDGKIESGLNLECANDGKVEEIAAEVRMGDAFLCVPGEIKDEPVWCDTDCGLIGQTMETDTIKIAGSVHKIIRRWALVDWCTYNPNSDNLDDDNDTVNDQYQAVEDWAQGECAACPGYGPVADSIYIRYIDVDIDGYYTFDQVIVIEDDAAPEITAPDEFKVITNEGAETKDDVALCVGSANITASATDFCNGSQASNNDLQWNVSISKNGEVLFTERLRGEAITINSLEGSPGDIHIITWKVTDGKGNETTHTTRVLFGDSLKPTPICVSGLTTVFFDDDGTALIPGHQFDFGSFDNCTEASDLVFSILPKGVIPNSPGEGGFDSQRSIIINCNEIANYTDLDVWVWDSSGNGAKCTVGLLFTGADDCPNEPEAGSGATISGGVQSLFGEMMKDVEITVSSNLDEYPIIDMTDETGVYDFSNNPLNQNYRIEASMNDEAINGVSTLDAVLIQRHILSLTNFDNPHKIIAADVNNDAVVRVSDVLELRRLILGVTDRFPDNESWRFVRAAQDFLDEQNPFPFIEIIDVIDLQDNQMQENFIGVKIGDVNGDAAHSNFSQLSEVREGVSVNLKTIDQNLKRGDVIKMPISSTNFRDVAGFQFTMNHNGLTLNDIEGNGIPIDESNIARHGDELSFSWSNPEFAESGEDILFYLIFEASEDLKLSESISLTSQITKREAYIARSFEIVDVDLSFENEVPSYDEVILYQNEPNPFLDETVVKFYLPKDQKVNLVIFDLAGQVIKSTAMDLKIGEHSVRLSESDFSSTGVFYYKLETAHQILTKKLILIE